MAESALGPMAMCATQPQAVSLKSHRLIRWIS
jgi:hypothetical protein